MLETDIEVAQKLTAAQQTEQSKLARWVWASIEMPHDRQRQTGGVALFDKSYERAMVDHAKWRENPDKVISASKPKTARKTKAEKEAEANRHQEEDRRRMQETVEASNLSSPPPMDVLGSDLNDHSATGSETVTIDGPAETPPATEATDEIPADQQPTGEASHSEQSAEFEQPAAPEPKPVRWHAIFDDNGEQITLKPEDATSLLGSDVMAQLPPKGCLTFEICDGSVVITGWEGTDRD